METWEKVVVELQAMKMNGQIKIGALKVSRDTRGWTVSDGSTWATCYQLALHLAPEWEQSERLKAITDRLWAMEYGEVIEVNGLEVEYRPTPDGKGGYAWFYKVSDGTTWPTGYDTALHLRDLVVDA